jgi:hypothetical protein
LEHHIISTRYNEIATAVDKAKRVVAIHSVYTHTHNLGPTCRCEDNINMNFRKIGCEALNWIQLAKDRVQFWAFVNVLMNHKVP